MGKRNATKKPPPSPKRISTSSAPSYVDSGMDGGGGGGTYGNYETTSSSLGWKIFFAIVGLVLIGLVIALIVSRAMILPPIAA